ncbi:hypothetical protein [Ferrimonas sediminum]|nr:hypothetical protein [Ferrimonas sediminum]
MFWQGQHDSKAGAPLDTMPLSVTRFGNEPKPSLPHSPAINSGG